MRNKLFILFLGIIYLLSSSRSCSDENSPGAREKARLNAARDSVIETFESEYLNDVELHAYELSAIQKLEDLAYYFRILNDTSADFIFREKAAEMVTSVFLSQHSKVNLKAMELKNTIEISTLIQNALSNQYAYSKFIIKDIHTLESLKRQSDTLYTGKLQFRLSQSLQDQAGKNAESVNQAVVDMHVVRVVKIFGKEKIRVWKVFLGEMREFENLKM